MADEFAFGRRTPARYYFVFPLRGGHTFVERITEIIKEDRQRNCRVMPQHLYSSDIIESYLDDFVHYADTVVGIAEVGRFNAPIYFKTKEAICHAREIGKRVIAFVMNGTPKSGDVDHVEEIRACGFDHVWWFDSGVELEKAVRSELSNELLYVQPDANRLFDGSDTRLASALDAHLRLFEMSTVALGDVLALSPIQFERLVADIWRRFGYLVELTAQTRDGGYDVVAMKDRETKVRFLIECKRYDPEHRIGVGFVRSLYGVKNDAKATKAILATTSTFTKPAQQFQESHDWELELRNYQGILDWIRMAKAGAN